MATAPFRKDHIGTLDGLRAVAVLLVLWQHIPQFALPLAIENVRRAVFGDALAGDWPLRIDWLRDEVFAAGYLGVDVFFVLSGFLITRILLVDRAGGVPLLHFLMRRLLRIFPIYYLTLLAVWLVRPHAELPWCALYLSNFYYLVAPGGVMQHSWSLAVEEHFYLVWPLLVYSLSRAASRRLAALVLVPGAIASTVVLAIVWRDDLAFVMQASQYGTMFRVSSLASGALLAYHEASLRGGRGRSLWLAGGMLVVASGLRIVLPHLDLGTGVAVARQFTFGLTSVGLVIACIAGRDGNGPIARCLRSAPLRFVGRISYGLYLYHFVVYHWLGVYAPAGDLQQLPVGSLLAGAVGATFAIATLSYYLIERPCLRFAARFRSG